MNFGRLGLNSGGCQLQQESILRLEERDSEESQSPEGKQNPLPTPADGQSAPRSFQHQSLHPLLCTNGGVARFCRLDNQKPSFSLLWRCFNALSSPLRLLSSFCTIRINFIEVIGFQTLV